MAEADWHLKDLLAFYVSKCRSELLAVSDDFVQAERMSEAVKHVRELLILMSCMVGALTPSEIAALQRLDQVRLVAENHSAQMLRVGEDMALLRLWVKSAGDTQWNVADAARLFRAGSLTASSSLPEMVCDLLTSAKKPFVVPSSLPTNWELARSILQESILAQFNRAKSEFPFVPSRVTLSFDSSDDSVILESIGEFRIRGIFDHRRWTIMDAQILDDSAGKSQCRQVLQTLSNSSVAEMCCAAMRMATAQKLKQFQDEAVLACNQAWLSVHSVSKSKSGLGNGFQVGLFLRLLVDDIPFGLSFDMNFDNGDFIVSHLSPSISFSDTRDLTKTFSQNIQIAETHIRSHVLGTYIPSLLSLPPTTASSVLVLPDAGVSVSLPPSGLLEVVPSFANLPPVTFSCDPAKFIHHIEVFTVAYSLFEYVQRQQAEGFKHCCATSEVGERGIEVSQNWSEFVETLRNRNLQEDFANGVKFVLGFVDGDGEVKSVEKEFPNILR